MKQKLRPILFTRIFFSFAFLLLFITCDDIYIQDLFTKDPGAGIITPEQEASYVRGGVMSITWQHLKGEKVKIELCNNEDEFIKLITASTENDGEFSWVIPTTMWVSEDYFIKITIIDSPPYSGNSYMSSQFYIDTNAWEELASVQAQEAYDVAITLGPDNCPALAFGDIVDRVKLARFVKWDDSNNSWNGDYLSEFNSNYYSIAAGTDNNPYIAYADGMQEIRVKKWENNSLTDCGHVHPFLDPIPDSIVFGTAIALNTDNTPYVSYMAFSLMNLFRKDKPYCLYTSVYDGSEWVSCGEILYSTDTETNLSLEVAVSLAEPFYIYTGSHGVVMSFDLLALFKFFFFSVPDESFFSSNSVNDLVDDMDIPLYPSIAIGPNNVPVLTYINLEYTYPNLTTRKIYIQEYHDADENYEYKHWSFWDGKSALNNDDNPLIRNDGDFQSIAIGTDNNPAIVYTDNTNGYIVRVKRWNPDTSTWVSLESPGTCPRGMKPSIVIDKNNNPIVACKNGVKRWNDSEHKWECLGFPNQPGNGSGNQSSWLAVNDNYLAVAYIKPGERDKVCVKMLEL